MLQPVQFRATKITLCITLLAALTSLLLATFSLAEREHGLIAQLAPAAVLAALWRVAGWLWFYVARQHAPWGFEYIRFWLRDTTSDRRH